MFAIIQTGGKQYKVEPNKKIKIEKLDAKEGAEVVFDQVLMIADGDKTKVGTPFLEKAKVTGLVLKQGRTKKIDVIKYKPKIRYRKKFGHRQMFSEIEIKEIQNA